MGYRSGSSLTHTLLVLEGFEFPTHNWEVPDVTPTPYRGTCCPFLAGSS